MRSRTNLPNFLLCYLGDLNEMAHWIEGRLPYLDHSLREYVNQLPPSVKIRQSTEKWLLREAVKPYITVELYFRRKHVFNAPPAATKNTPHSIYLNNRLTKQAVESLGFLRWNSVEDLKVSFLEHKTRRAHNLLNTILSMVIISEKFGVKSYGKESFGDGESLNGVFLH